MQRSGIHSVFGCIFISITAAAVSISQPGSAFIKSWWLVKVTVLEDKSQDEQNWWLYGERPDIIIGPVESSRVAWGQGLQYLHCLVPEHGRVNRIINTSAHRHGQAILTRANQTNRTSRHSVFLFFENISYGREKGWYVSTSNLVKCSNLSCHRSSRIWITDNILIYPQKSSLYEHWTEQKRTPHHVTWRKLCIWDMGMV